MDAEALAGMIFTLLLALIVGGFILLFPLSRRLGAVLEQRLREKRPGPPDPEALEALRTAVHALEAEVQTLAERQAFVDSLLVAREPSRLAGSADPRATTDEPRSRETAHP